MKRLFALLAVAFVGISLTSCSYDDTDLWNEVEGIKDRVQTLEEAVTKTNEDIAALQTIVNALQNNVYVTSVNTTANGYTITFSDGTTATISNGKDGANGTNAPVVSIEQDSTDKNYYWTINGEWLLVNGERVRANGIDGEDGAASENGKDAIAPQVRINDNTKEWEISTDGGKTWVSTGVVAEGKDGANGTNGDSLFKNIDTSNPDYVIVTLANGTELRLARHNDSAPTFVITNAPKVAQVEYGKSVEFAVEAKNIADYVITPLEGWKAVYAEGTLKITAPAKDLCHFDKEGVIAITVVSAEGKSSIVKLNVMAGEWVEEKDLRTLTFEDKDKKFDSFYLDYANNYEGKEITKWSDLIDSPQYMGPLTYGNDQMDAMYWWYDQNNTELMHVFPYNYAYCFWGGGHAISNYWGEGYTDEDRNKHIAKYYGQDYVDQWAGQPGADGFLGWFNVQMMVPAAPHSGNNFAVHYGYKDFFNYIENLPEFYFADGESRVIDHMYVINTNYTLNQLVNGVKSEEGNSFGGSWEGLNDEAWLKIVAQGFDDVNADAYAEPISEVEFYLVQGQNVVTDWQKWDLSPLGKVAKVRFNFLYSEDMGGKYGFTIPGYFAYDDVAVDFGSKRVFK